MSLVSSKYFAADESDKTASAILKKAEFWGKALITTSYLEKCKNCWRAYNGNYYADGGHSITFGGEQGELAQIPVNHLRNIGQHLKNMITANRPSLEAVANNTDYKTLAQTKLANGLLNYYMSEKKLEEYLVTAVEYSIVLGEGFIKIEWDSTSGSEYGFNEETKTMIYEGDIKFTNLSPYDVIRDTSREDQDHDWLAIRTFKNRYDLIAKYPEFENEILGVESKDKGSAVFTSVADNDTDLIPVIEFYHKRSEALPDGRYMIFISADAVFYDGPLPYRFMPIFRIAPANIIGTSFGYTPLFDLMPLQEAVNGLYSTALTNQNAFGVQSILVPKGSDVTAQSLTGGLNLIEYPEGMQKPEALQLTSTPAEIFRFMEMLIGDMETLSGVNSVVRGNPEASLESGAALAMIQAQAVQFASGLQQSYIRLIEDVGMSIIELLQDFATVPRVAAIIGKSNRSYMKEFIGEDLTSIKRVRVTVANPLSKTTAGRMEIANNLIQMGLVKNLSDYFTVLNTGSLDSITEGEQSELFLIKSENEEMMDGKEVTVTAIDEHLIHIQEHRSLIADPKLRKNPQLVALVLDHIQKHVDALRTTDPSLLQLLGQQPLPPAQGQPGEPQQAPEQGQPTQEAMQQAQQNSQIVTEPLPVGVEQANEVRQPNMPNPPAPFQNLPTNPGDQFQNLANQG